MLENGRNKVVELFPQQIGGPTLRSELWKSAERIGDALSELRKELPPNEVQRLGPRLDDIGDMVIFLRALSGV